MMYLVVIFISPLYFLIRGKWLGLLVNGTLYLLVWLTVWFFGLGMIFWALGVGHAMWEMRKELMTEQAEIIAKKMAEEMRKQPSQETPG